MKMVPWRRKPQPSGVAVMTITIDGSSRFVALVDFFSEETKSQYCAGLSYTVREDKLGSLVDRWVAEGKVQMGSSAPSEISGKG